MGFCSGIYENEILGVYTLIDLQFGFRACDPVQSVTGSPANGQFGQQFKGVLGLGQIVFQEGLAVFDGTGFHLVLDPGTHLGNGWKDIGHTGEHLRMVLGCVGFYPHDRRRVISRFDLLHQEGQTGFFVFGLFLPKKQGVHESDPFEGEVRNSGKGIDAMQGLDQMADQDLAVLVKLPQVIGRDPGDPVVSFQLGGGFEICDHRDLKGKSGVVQLIAVFDPIDQIAFQWFKIGNSHYFPLLAGSR